MREQAEEVKARLSTWLAPRGLAFNEGKTRVVHLDEGFDFLGFNVRRHKGKLLIKPSKAAVRRLRATARRRDEGPARVQRSGGDQTAEPDHSGLVGLLPDGCVQTRCSPGWTTTCGVLTYKWAKYSHANKPKRWVVARYFGQFNKSRRNRWVFGDRSSGAYLLKFAWTKIVRHQMVPGTASPDDPALAEYWARRRRRATPPLDGISLALLRAQGRRCPVCGGLLLLADHEPSDLPEWEEWLTVTLKAVRKKAITAERELGMPGDRVALHLVHAHCRQWRLTALSVPGTSARS